MEVQINIWAVVVAAVSAMVIGAIWYAQSVFGKAWARLARVDTKKNTSPVKPMIIFAAASLLTAYIVAHVTYLSNQFFDDSFLQDALSTAFWLWIGLVAAQMITHDAFEGRPKALTLINVSFEFVTLISMGLIIGWMGL